MDFQTSGLVCFVATDGPLVERDFDIMDENIEQEKGITVLVKRLLGRFAIDGGDEGIVAFHENGVEKLGEVVLKVFEGNVGQNS